MMIIRTSSIFAFLVLLMIESAAGQALVKPGCRQDSCGNVSIPYPFGIGTDCCMNKGFEVSCDDTSEPPRIFLNLTSGKIEVLYFSLVPSFIRVKLPINCLRCTKALAPLNISGSPFKSVWSADTLEEEYLPGVLEWGITDADVSKLPPTYENAFNCSQFSGTNDTTRYGYYRVFYGDNTNLSMSSSANQQCVCERGFQGNPYLPHGCHGELLSPSLFL
ncbi:hypothetical protein SLEP1_g36091 [Rubroshorea leprosula]|uniref:Wall-associated receptor kinase galacturonan-binding domain-containing protein n=1 Tax=Rubroshorea leprosula TaxID=152421 RepID=A0AAV5KQX4_9ROSI|nr:hypothetical protein SLEP1_g36091 [Rubroshorea leprosula]